MRKQSIALRAAAAAALLALAWPAQATNGYFPHGFGLKAKGMGGLHWPWPTMPLPG